MADAANITVFKPQVTLGGIALRAGFSLSVHPLVQLLSVLQFVPAIFNLYQDLPALQRSQGAVRHLKRSAKHLIRDGSAVRQCAHRGLESALRERQPCRCLAASPAKNQTTGSMQSESPTQSRKKQSHVPPACHYLPASPNQNRKCAANFSHILIHESTKDICKQKFTSSIEM